MIELGPDDGILILAPMQTMEQAQQWRSMFDEHLPNLSVMFINGRVDTPELIIVRGAKWTTQYVLDIATANDDPYPDDVCPGCGADIWGWRDYMAHRRGGGWIGDNGIACPWDRDYLSARAHRRRLIDEGVTR